MTERKLAKRIVSEIYSRTAGSLYEPIVVRGTFRIFAEDLERLVAEQGQNAVETADGGPILDMPIGTGHFTTKFAHYHSGLVVGTDIAHGMLVKTMQAAARERASNIVGVRGDAHALPFATGAFPAIMCSNGLQVIPGLERTLQELHRVLQPEGLMQVSIVNFPLGTVLPDVASEHLPTLLKSRAAMIFAIKQAGFSITNVSSARWATLVEARKS